MPPLHDPGYLLRELQDNNAFFDSLVDMIPAKLYIAGNTGAFSFVLCNEKPFSPGTYSVSYFSKRR
jgi:hypothetical protein